MISFALAFAVLTAFHDTPRSWVSSQDAAGNVRLVWGWEDGGKVYHYEHEQYEAHQKHKQYLTGVDPRHMRADSKQVRASDPATEAAGRELLNHAHGANDKCPDGPRCPNKPKDPNSPETKQIPVKVDWNLRPEYIAAIGLVVLGALILRGSNEQHPQ